MNIESISFQTLKRIVRRNDKIKTLKPGQMTAIDIKYYLKYYFLNKRRFFLTAAEQSIGWFNADLLIYDHNFQLIEIEIKISKGDFNGELKSIQNILSGNERTPKCKKYDKHYKYLLTKQGYTPHRFYYCVPESLKDYCYEYLRNTPYGLLVISENKRYDNVKVIKSGKLLHKEKIDKNLIENSFRNLCYENLRLSQNNRKLNEQILKASKEAEAEEGAKIFKTN